ncbi:hypothetical protein AGMMS49944_00210 [Spirochaetia bacterium]|nr:hypothetical protein AGMMS49944_00210 [Spirochaetia bacterium]
MKKLIAMFNLLFLSLPIYAADMYTGDGARGTRLAVAAPAGKNLAADETWLSLYIQGILTGNFNKYSAMTIIDRQNLDKVEAEQSLSLSGLYSNDDYIRIGNLTNAQYILAGSIEKLRNEQFSLQLTITALDTGTVRASFTKTCSAAELRGGMALNEASADLLAKMGVQLTDKGKRELQAASTANTDAQTALAKGIRAQQSGNAVEALSYFYQAAAVDPALTETAGRLNVLSSRISGGDLGQNVRNQIAARNAWIALLKDCAAFYKTHMPFDIVYDPALRQIGDTDYANAAADFSFTVELPPAEVAFKVINDLISGLETTGQRAAWDFAGWPLINGSKYPEPTAVVFEGKRNFSFNVVAAVIDGRGRTIGTDTITLTSGNISFNAGDRTLGLPVKVSTDARFLKVNVKDYIPPLTVKIISVNSIPAETAMETGYMRVLTQAEHYALPEEAAKRQAAAEAANRLAEQQRMEAEQRNEQERVQAEQAKIKAKQEQKRANQERMRNGFRRWVAGDDYAGRFFLGYVYDPILPIGLRIGGTGRRLGIYMSAGGWASNPSDLPDRVFWWNAEQEVLEKKENIFFEMDWRLYYRVLNNFFIDVGIGFFANSVDVLYLPEIYDEPVWGQDKDKSFGLVLQVSLLYSFKWFYLSAGYRQYFNDSLTPSFYAGAGWTYSFKEK